MQAPRTLVLLSKPGCHLCEEMRAVVEPLLRAHGLDLVEKDVRDDPELSRRYLLAIPVLLCEGRELARHRLGPDDLQPLLVALGVG